VDKEIIKVSPISEALEKGKIPLSPAVKANGFVFVSGLPPFDRKTGAMVKGDIAAQTEASLENVRAALEAAGSSLDKVVKVTIYIANAAWFPTVNAVYARYFTNNPPARTFVAVGSWPLEFDIEVECIAVA
jgi:2-iminobutanoate/2-iminopropanoate deaminase